MLHLFEPKLKENKTFYIIRITKNIENGISIEAYDFQRDIWQEHILHLNSMFLQCMVIDSSNSSQVYKEIGDISCSVFTILAQG